MNWWSVFANILNIVIYNSIQFIFKTRYGADGVENQWMN